MPNSCSFDFHSFGRLKSKKVVAELPLTVVTPVVLPLTITKKSAAVIAPTPALPLSKSDSFRKYLRAEGKKLAMHALSDGPYPEMPETPPRFKKHVVKTITPASSADDITSFLATYRDAFKNIADNLEEFGSISPPAAEDVFGPEESSSPSPAGPVLPPAEDDFVVIDLALSDVFNLRRRPSSMRRVVNKVKRLSRRASDKENVPSHSPTNSARASITSFSPSKLLSRKIHLQEVGVSGQVAT
jgi:hypothetical protein